MTEQLGLNEVGSLSEQMLEQIERAVVGKRDALELVLLGLLADGHVLIEDYPGLAKTLIARSFAQVSSMTFARIQFTPDLMPSDVTGGSIYNQRDGAFQFQPGPIFTNLLLGDEINRAPPKTQAAMLEAMQERQVSIDGETHRLAPPFLVLATQNPIEYEGTYPLPEAQLDRFLLRISVGYPERADEATMLERRGERRQEQITLEPIVDGPTLLAMQRAIEEVHVSESIRLYIVDLVRATRDSSRAQVGASPRGSLALFTLSRARAALEGRDFVTPDDVKRIAVPALSHRLTLPPELWVQRVRPEEVIEDVLRTVPTPEPEEAGPASA
ncbi:MAG TPA: MoxR family ATPase [Gaiellaceae bacterium]